MVLALFGFAQKDCSTEALGAQRCYRFQRSPVRRAQKLADWVRLALEQNTLNTTKPCKKIAREP
jgi:hypothetical protein